ncbi:excinuclease Cho [Serratia sp. NPDC078593]|uniref:excinuclease Cho n=1 Tax=unclassified Serratia (in: enterobacteria) TaxID=2647522 RepID=UPI0037D71B9C
MMSHQPEPGVNIYQYPEHLRDYLAILPKAPGVYVFHGNGDRMPLYIGKSVNIRSRVMAHFRCKDEGKLLRQTQRISFIETAGELGALLIEAQMIKKLQPLFNKRLRRSRQLCSLYLHAQRLDIVYAKDIDFATTPALYGLFANRTTALEKLRAIADEHRLCYGTLGIETLPSGKACFRYSLRKCHGVCCGEESLEAHTLRLVRALERLQINCWPYRGRVALFEQRERFQQYHIIHNWFYLGTVSSLDQAECLQRTASHFDSDSYKVLCRPLLSGEYPMIEMDE